MRDHPGLNGAGGWAGAAGSLHRPFSLQIRRRQDLRPLSENNLASKVSGFMS